MYLTNNPWEPLKSKRPGYTLRTNQYTFNTSPIKVMKLGVSPQRYENSDSTCLSPSLSPALSDVVGSEPNTSVRDSPRSNNDTSKRKRSSRKRIAMSPKPIKLSGPNDSKGEVSSKTSIKETVTCTTKRRKRKCITMRTSKKNVEKSINTTRISKQSPNMTITNNSMESAEKSTDSIETQEICEVPMGEKQLSSSNSCNKLAFDLWHPRHVQRNHILFNELDVCMSTYMNIVNESIQSQPDAVCRKTLDRHRHLTRKTMMSGLLLGYTVDQLEKAIN